MGALTLTVITTSVPSLAIGTSFVAGADDAQVCDVDADYSVGVEDYSETTRGYFEVVRQHAVSLARREQIFSP